MFFASFVLLAALTTEVKPFGGAPALWIDGRPATGLMHWNNRLGTNEAEVVRKVGVFKDAGLHLYSFNVTLREDGTIDDGQIARLVRADPSAKVLIRFAPVITKEWVAAHPEDMAQTFCAGETKLQRCPSVASPAVRALYERQLRALVRQAESTWGDVVLGYHPGMGACGENAHAWERGVADVSPAALAGFKGGKVDPNVYFMRDFRDRRRLLDPVREKAAIELMRYESELMAEAVCFQARVVKDELRKLGRTKICGAFYCYTSMPLETYAGVQDGHQCHDPVLASPDIDFIAAPIDYTSRQLGGTAYAQCLPASIALHGKLYWAEEDSRYHTERADIPDRVSLVADDTASLVRRNFLDAWSHGGTIWWMDLFGRGWYDDASFTPLLDGCRRFAERHFDRRESVAEVAVFVDEHSMDVDRLAPVQLSTEILQTMMPEICALGAPYDIYRLGDLTALAKTKALAQYRLAVVLTSHAARAEDRVAVKALLCKDGRTVVFTGPAGYVNGTTASATNVTDLTGFAVVERKSRDTEHVEWFADGHRHVFGATRSPEKSLLVVDPAATSVGWYVQATWRAEGGGVALAEKEFADWTGVLATTGFVPSELLRRYAARAGVHLYSEAGDQVFAGPGWFAVAAKQSGERTLRPRTGTPISVTLNRGDCRLFEETGVNSSAAPMAPQTFCNPIPAEKMPIGIVCWNFNDGDPITPTTPNGCHRWWYTTTNGIATARQYREMADPETHVWNGAWYLYSSCGWLWKSTDAGGSWSRINVMDHDPDYAPTVEKFRGKYYLTACFTPLKVADSPEGPFRELGKFDLATFRSDPKQNVRLGDPQLFADGDHLYLYWGLCEKDIWGTELDPENPTKALKPAVKLCSMAPGRPWMRRPLEGAFVFKRGDEYYLLHSGNEVKTGSYCMSVWRAKSPLGPFTPQAENPFFFAPKSGMAYGGGHGSAWQDERGDFWINYTICPKGKGFHGFQRYIGQDRIEFAPNGDIKLGRPTDEPQWLPSSGKKGPTGWKKLPLTTTATKAVDDEPYTYETLGELPSKTIFELGRTCEINAFRLFWMDLGLDVHRGVPGGPYRYRVERREQGEWKLWYDATDNDRDLTADYREAPAATADAVRLVVVGAPKGLTPALGEFTVFGKGLLTTCLVNETPDEQHGVAILSHETPDRTACQLRAVSGGKIGVNQ